MTNKIIDRILREIKIPNLLEALVERISMPDLVTILLDVFKRRVKLLTPGELFEQYQKNRLVQISPVPPELFLQFDQLAYSLLPGDFEAVELSPVCPLGTCSIIASVDQNNVLTTIRKTEVCSDATNVMALECARRRKKWQSLKEKAKQRIKLAASHRLLRTQMFDTPDSYPHFKIFSLCAAGQDEGNFIFELDNLTEQLDFYLRLLQSIHRIGMEILSIRVVLLVMNPNLFGTLNDKVVDNLKMKYPLVQFEVKEYENPPDYYLQVRLNIFAVDTNGQDYFLIDGGFTNWTQKILSNRKERLFISGLGSERLIACFGNKS